MLNNTLAGASWLTFALLLLLTGPVPFRALCVVTHGLGLPHTARVMRRGGRDGLAHPKGCPKVAPGHFSSAPLFRGGIGGGARTGSVPPATLDGCSTLCSASAASSD